MQQGEQCMFKSRKNLLFLVLLLIVVGWSLKGRFLTQITNADPKGSSIILFGDSIAAGYQVQPEQCYASLLSKDFGMPIINAGVPGDTTGSALGRLQADVLARDPKVVMVELGGNDLLQQVSHAVIQKNLESIVSQIQARGAAVVIVGVDGPFGLGGMGSVYKKVANEYHTAYVPNIMSNLLGDKNYMADQIHPNAAGHVIIAKRIGAVLRKSLPKVFGGQK